MPPKDRGWRLTKTTVADLREIWTHTQKRWSIEQADKYHNDIIATVADLAAERKRGRKIEVSTRLYLYYGCGSHNIFFREEKNRIVVVRILHNRMDFKRHL